MDDIQRTIVLLGHEPSEATQRFIASLPGEVVTYLYGLSVNPLSVQDDVITALWRINKDVNLTGLVGCFSFLLVVLRQRCCLLLGCVGSQVPNPKSCTHLRTPTTASMSPSKAKRSLVLTWSTVSCARSGLKVYFPSVNDKVC